MRLNLLSACGLLAFAAAVPSFAGEELDLANGAKLIGTVIKEEKGKIYFHADLIGDVVIDASAVTKRIETSALPPSVAPVALPAGPARPVPVVSSAPPGPQTGPSAAATAAGPSGPSEAAAASKNQVFWKRILSVSGSYTSAPYNQGAIKGAPADFPLTGAQAGLQGTQATLQASGTLIGATPYQSIVLTGSLGYAEYQPAGTVMNNHSVEGTYTYIISPLDYWLTRSTYSVDKPAFVQHAFEQVVGFGHKFIDNDRVHLDLIPGLSMVNDNRGNQWDNKWILSGGFLEHLDYAFNDRVSLEQRFKYRVGIDHPTVWAIDSYLGIKAALSAHVSFNTGVTFTYDNTLGPMPATLVPTLLAEGIPLDTIDRLDPGNKYQALLSSGFDYNW